MPLVIANGVGKTATVVAENLGCFAGLYQARPGRPLYLLGIPALAVGHGDVQPRAAHRRHPLTRLRRRHRRAVGGEAAHRELGELLVSFRNYLVKD